MWKAPYYIPEAENKQHNINQRTRATLVATPVSGDPGKAGS